MFKDQLKQLRQERGLNNCGLAEALGVSPGSVTGYLSGKVTPPYKKQQQFACALGLDADYFKPDIAEEIQADGGYRLSAATAAALMGISRDNLLDLLEEGTFTFGRVWKNRGAAKRTCWISRILFEQDTGIPVPVKE